MKNLKWLFKEIRRLRKKMTKEKEGVNPGDINSEELAYSLIKALMDTSTTDDFHDRVLEWFGSEAGDEQKHKALMRYMYENLKPSERPKDSTVRQFNELAGRLGIELSGSAPVAGTRPLRRPIIRKVLWRVAAVLVPAVVVLGVYFGTRNQSVSPVPEIMAEVIVEDTPGAVRDIVLSDGTKVSVASGGRFVYPDPFTGDRQVQLEGEATFDVTHTEGVPFTVTTPHVTVTVLGTKFTVTDSEHAARTQVALYEGSVSVGSSAGTHILERGHYFDLDNNTREVTLTSISGEYLDFLGYKPSLKLDNVPLSEILFSVEKNFSVSFNVAQGVNTGGNYSVSYEGESLDNILYALSGTLGINFRRDGETVYVSK